MIPESLRYSRNHEWIKPEGDGTMTVGVTFHAQAQLGDVVYIKHPDVGHAVKLGIGEGRGGHICAAVG